MITGDVRLNSAVSLPMVLICNGPEIALRRGTCCTEIKHIGYDPGQPWPAAEALGWGVSQDPRGRPGWDHRCPECLAEIANQTEPMDVVGEDSPASNKRRR